MLNWKNTAWHLHRPWFCNDNSAKLIRNWPLHTIAPENCSRFNLILTKKSFNANYGFAAKILFAINVRHCDRETQRDITKSLKSWILITFTVLLMTVFVRYLYEARDFYPILHVTTNSCWNFNSPWSGAIIFQSLDKFCNVNLDEWKPNLCSWGWST